MEKRHVPDLELCQILDTLCKEKNITLPETEFYWMSYGTPYVATKTARSIFYDHTWAKHSIPAPLVSEQGEWMPLGYSSMKSGSMFKKARYICGQYEEEGRDSSGSTEANARQKMLNYLIAEGIITKL